MLFNGFVFFTVAAVLVRSEFNLSKKGKGKVEFVGMVLRNALFFFLAIVFVYNNIKKYSGPSYLGSYILKLTCDR